MSVALFIPGETAQADADRADWAAGLTALRAFIDSRPGIRLPEPGSLAIRPQGATIEERRADLHEIASQWETEPVRDHGALIMRRCFGPVWVTAHVGPQYRTLKEYFAATDALKAARQRGTVRAA